MSLPSLSLADTMGWIATAVFVTSYFFSKPAMLRGLEMVGATLWIAFGVLIASKPAIASNVLVFAAAAWTLVWERARSPSSARCVSAKPIASGTTADSASPLTTGKR